MFTGVPPVYKRILNMLLIFDDNLHDHDFNLTTIYNVDNMLNAEHMLKQNTADLTNLLESIHNLVDEEKELLHVNAEIYETDQVFSKKSEYIIGQSKDIQKFVKKL